MFIIGHIKNAFLRKYAEIRIANLRIFFQTVLVANLAVQITNDGRGELLQHSGIHLCFCRVCHNIRAFAYLT